MVRPFVFGLIGGILGILGGLLVAVVGGFLTLLAGIGLGILISAIMGIVFSIIGAVASLMDGNKVIGGVLMIISGAIVLLTLSLIGILTFILFLIGGVLLLTERVPQPISPVQQSTNPYAQPYKASAPSNETIQYSQDRCQMCNYPVTMEQEYCGNCGAQLKMKG